MPPILTGEHPPSGSAISMRRRARLSNGNRCIPRPITAPVRRACAEFVERCPRSFACARRCRQMGKTRACALRRRDVTSCSFGTRAVTWEKSKWPGKHRRSLKFRLGWKSTCTPARRASKPRCNDLPGSSASPCVVAGAAARQVGLALFFLHKCRKSLGIIRMPARQRGPVLDDIAGRPQDAPLVEFAAARHCPDTGCRNRRRRCARS